MYTFSCSLNCDLTLSLTVMGTFKFDGLVSSILVFILMFSLSLSVSSEESISRWMADYFKRIHDHIGNENYDKAEKELEMGDQNYFRGGRTY